MSLAPVVGYREMVAEDEEGLEWFLEDLAKINAALATKQLPAHVEPETLPPYGLRVELNHLGTSWLHHLRRLQGHVQDDDGAGEYVHAPVSDEAEPWMDPVVLDRFTHLIDHHDTQGYYVPIDFKYPIAGGPGGKVGSSVRLLGELRALAPFLGIRLEADGSLSDAEAARIAPVDQDGDPAYREKAAWLLLFEVARTSVELKTLIRFCN